MSRFKKVLCVIDPTATSQPALQRAVWFAKQASAKLELLICYYNEFLSGHTVFDSRSLKKARAEAIELHGNRLEELAEPGRALGLEVETVAVWDHPLCEGIVRHACSTEADIVFKDTHQHSGLAPDRAFKYGLEPDQNMSSSALARQATRFLKTTACNCCH